MGPIEPPPTTPLDLASLAGDLRAQILSLPRLARLVVRFLTVASQGGSAGALARGLESDPVLARWLLRQANSSYFNLSRPVGSLSEALVAIGVEPLTRMVFAACTRDLLDVPLRRYPAGGADFWRHGLVCGTMARALSRHVGAACGLEPDEALIAGLLHDVGKRALDPLLASGPAHHPVGRDDERAAAGADHAAVSACIGRGWDLPAAVVQAIAEHHESDASPAGSLLALANGLSHHCRDGRRCDVEVPAAAWQAWRATFDLSLGELRSLLAGIAPVLEGLGEMLRLLGHDHVPPDRAPSSAPLPVPAPESPRGSQGHRYARPRRRGDPRTTRRR